MAKPGLFPRATPWQARALFEKICAYGFWGIRLKYVCILQCENEPVRHYTGSTDDLRARLKAHKAGQVPHTSKFRPWRLNTYIGFSDLERAVRFEKHLKTHSGRAFARKHL